VSVFGSQLTFVALPWFVLSETGSATLMGIVFAAGLLPVALLGIPSGAVVQRLGARRTMDVANFARVPLLAAVPVLHGLGALPFPLLVAIALVIGAFGAPYISAQRLLLSDVFGDDTARIVQANGLLEGASRLAALIGPAVVGVLISAVGAVNVLYVNAATFLIAFVVLAVGLPRTGRPAEAGGGRGGLWAGAKFVLSDRLLRRVSVASLMFGLFFPPLLVSLPVITSEAYGGDPRVAGLLFAAWGAGAVIGTFGVMRYATRMTPIRLGVAAPLWLLLVPLSAWQFGLVLVVSGIFTPMLNAPLITLVTVRTPPALRAKAMTFVMTANLLAGPLAFGLAGPALDLLGTWPVRLLVAAGVSAAALLLLLIAGTTRIGDAAPAAAETGAAEADTTGVAADTTGVAADTTGVAADTTGVAAAETDTAVADNAGTDTAAR